MTKTSPAVGSQMDTWKGNTMLQYFKFITSYICVCVLDGVCHNDINKSFVAAGMREQGFTEILDMEWLYTGPGSHAYRLI